MDKTVTMHSCQCLVHSAVADYHIRKPLYGKILQMLGFHLALISSNLNERLPHNNCFKTSVPNIETVLSVTVPEVHASSVIVEPGVPRRAFRGDARATRFSVYGESPILILMLLDNSLSQL